MTRNRLPRLRPPHYRNLLGAFGGETMVFPRADMVAATEGILTDNGIREQGSPELMAVWKVRVEK